MLKTPDITTAQVIAGIPVVANLLAVFGVYSLTRRQTDALVATLVFSLGLLFSDGIIRHGRSKAIAASYAAERDAARALPPVEEVQ